MRTCNRALKYPEKWTGASCILSIVDMQAIFPIPRAVVAGDPLARFFGVAEEGIIGLSWTKPVNPLYFLELFWPKCVAATAVERFGIQGQGSRERKP